MNIGRLQFLQFYTPPRPNDCRSTFIALKEIKICPHLNIDLDMSFPVLTQLEDTHSFISTWIGAQASEFKHVYDLGDYGCHSDVRDGPYDGTQFECPLRGTPQWLFQSDLKLGGENVGYFRKGELGFMATSSYSFDTESNQILRRLAVEMGLRVLDLNDHTRESFAIDGFSLHRQFATFLCLPPTTFKLDSPFTCCDNHRTFFRLAAIGGPHRVDFHPIWLKDLLYDAEVYSTCLPFSKMPNGLYYKHWMRGDLHPSEEDSEHDELESHSYFSEDDSTDDDE